MGVSQNLGIPPIPPEQRSDILTEKMMPCTRFSRDGDHKHSPCLGMLRGNMMINYEFEWPPKKKRMIIGCPYSNCFGQSHVCYGHQSQCPYMDLGTLCGDQHVVSTGTILAPDSPSRVRGGPSKLSWSVTRLSRIYLVGGIPTPLKNICQMDLFPIYEK